MRFTEIIQWHWAIFNLSSQAKRRILDFLVFEQIFVFQNIVEWYDALFESNLDYKILEFSQLLLSTDNNYNKVTCYKVIDSNEICCRSFFTSNENGTRSKHFSSFPKINLQQEARCHCNDFLKLQDTFTRQNHTKTSFVWKRKSWVFPTLSHRTVLKRLKK